MNTCDACGKPSNEFICDDCAASDWMAERRSRLAAYLLAGIAALIMAVLYLMRSGHA